MDCPKACKTQFLRSNKINKLLHRANVSSLSESVDPRANLKTQPPNLNPAFKVAGKSLCFRIFSNKQELSVIMIISVS